MPGLATLNQGGNRQTASTKSNRSQTLIVNLEAKKKGTIFRSFIIWPLVVLSLIQVTSYLVSQHHHAPPQDSTFYSPSEHLLDKRVYRADGKVDFSNCISAQKTEEDQLMQYTFDVNSEQKTYHQEALNLHHNAYSCSSSSQQILTPNGLLSSSTLSYLSSYMNLFAQNIYTFLSQIETITAKTIFNSKVLLADAAQVSSNSMYQANQIIVLNSTNFNTELIQYNHPFPHIKLVEYYLAYCGICLKFKQTYVQLSKEIYSWRNVIRPSAIDLGVSNNSPIAHSWSIDVVPTLRIHPPPNSTVSMKLNELLSTKSSKSSQSDLQKAMYKNYSQANLMIDSLAVFKYTNDSKTLPDRVASLKLDLIRYIEKYVNMHSEELPTTWPNLKPITEKSLGDLRLHHPRQELFIIVEASGKSDSDHSSHLQPSLGIQVLMELSSSASWKAIRYVRASDNKAFVEDLIAHKKKESGEQIIDPQNSTNQNVAPNESIELLNNLLLNRQASQEDGNSIVLVHIDYSHWPSEPMTRLPTTKLPSITVVTGSDLVTADQQYSYLNSVENNNSIRTRRATRNVGSLERNKRSSQSDNSDPNKLSLQHKLRLVTQYINQTYTEVDEDRSFLKSLKSFDENPTLHDSNSESFVKFQRENQVALNQKIKKSQAHIEDSASSNSTFKQFLNRMNIASNDRPSSPKSDVYQDSQDDDYEDKLKAIRYIFFQEVPRMTLVDKNPVEKLEKLNTLINLASVIKVYFPLPDLASIQFIDAINNYLIKQQVLLSTFINNQQDRVSNQSVNNFDFRALKQVIKSLEAEGKRLPEIKDWKLCKYGGYPCALWRLFHTLTAFEYKKLSQINQQSSSKQVSKSSQQQSIAVQSPDNQTPSIEPPPSQEARSSLTVVENNNSPPSPVERLVSPPSTTTSLSLTIATPISAQDQQHASTLDNQFNNNRKQVLEAELPEPVLLVMRDYVTNFFGCEECAKNFRQETLDLSIDKIRRQEPVEFSVLWLWETHNRVSKRLSINSETNPSEHPKKWFPSYDQCPKCYSKPPSYLKDTNIELAAIFHESIQWNREEVLSYLVGEYTKQPMDKGTNIFGYSVPYGYNYIIVIGVGSLLLIFLLRCASCYIERQRRHKASLLTGNGAHYSVELQGS